MNIEILLNEAIKEYNKFYNVMCIVMLDKNTKRHISNIIANICNTLYGLDSRKYNRNDLINLYDVKTKLEYI